MGKLPANIKTLTAEILIYKDHAGRCVIEIGRRLKQVKESLPHGDWLPYLEKQVEFAERTAQQFIRCAEEFGNTQSTADLPTGHMFELLTLPSEQRKEFLQENNIQDMTQKQLREAIKAKKEAEERALQAERDKNAKQAYIDTLNQKVNHLMTEQAKNENLKSKVEILENKLRSAGEPIVVENPVQVFPPDYERVKRENAEFKARQQNMSLQQLAQIDATCRQYAKTEEEEKKLAKTVSKVLGVLLELPNNDEICELARCYLKFSPANATDEITVTCSEIDNSITKLMQLKTALQGAKKLRVVK